MDRPKLPEESRHELGMPFVAAPREAVTDMSVADLDGIERRPQEVGRQVLGQVVKRTVSL